METVSQLSKIIIKLDKEQLPCDYICQQVQTMLNKANQSGLNLNDSLLIMEIKTINESNNNHIPKIEFKNDTP